MDHHPSQQHCHWFSMGLGRHGHGATGRVPVTASEPASSEDTAAPPKVGDMVGLLLLVVVAACQ